MAPAVSWKSSSCCRKRMACAGNSQEGQGGTQRSVTPTPAPQHILGPRGPPGEDGGGTL